MLSAHHLHLLLASAWFSAASDFCPPTLPGAPALLADPYDTVIVTSAEEPAGDKEDKWFFSFSRVVSDQRAGVAGPYQHLFPALHPQPRGCGDYLHPHSATLMPS